MRAELLKKLNVFLAGELHSNAWDFWEVLRDEIEAERCENCKHVTVEHDNGTTVFCAHPEQWDNRERGFCCNHFAKKD